MYLRCQNRHIVLLTFLSMGSLASLVCNLLTFTLANCSTYVLSMTTITDDCKFLRINRNKDLSYSGGMYPNVPTRRVGSDALPTSVSFVNPKSAT